MADRLCVGGPLCRPLACFLQVGDGLRPKARLGEVMGQQLRLGLCLLRKVRLEHGGDAGVQLLALAAQQAGIGRVLHQRVLEGVDRVRRRPAAEDQLGVDQLVQRVGSSSSDSGATAASSSWLNSRPITAPICATSRTGAKPVEPRHQRVVQRRRDRQRRQRPVRAYRSPSSWSRPDSRTVLVSSSTNRGTPSVLATICPSTSAGRALPPRHPLDHGVHLALVEPVERQQGDMRKTRSRAVGTRAGR